MLADESYDDLEFADFADPPPPYRLQPWWFWNGKMDPDLMRWQIAEMDAKGCGGFYITPRQGMGVPYLSERYFERFHVALEQARNRQMLVGIMDDFPYPSGMAGGAATWANPAFIRAKLEVDSFDLTGPQELDELVGMGDVLRAWAWPVANGETDWSDAVDLRPHIGVTHAKSGLSWGQSLTKYSYARFADHAPTNELIWQVPDGNWRVMIFRVDRCRSFKYYGEFIDTCSREAVAHFLSITLGKHEDGLGTAELGTHLRSVFTDETQGGNWTRKMPRIFRQRCGYDLCEHLPALVDDSFPDAPRVRYDYLSTLHDLFMEAYHDQYAAECERRGLLYTTEVPMLRNADEGVAHIPGVDHAHDRIGEDLPHGWLERDPTYSRHWPRFKSSIAAQHGRARVAVEAFHSLGWGVRLADLKALIDRMTALGVNLIALHGFYYTAGGLAKFDAAPSEFYQHPWWRHFRKLADYAARLSWIASRGRDVAPVALLDPVTSLWTGGGDWWNVLRRLGADGKPAERIADDWCALMEALTTHQRLHHHLDPADLAGATIAGDELVVGQARYRALIVPPVMNLEADAFRRLEEFAGAGGIIIWVGLSPTEQIEPDANTPEAVGKLFGLDPGEVAAGYFGSAGNPAEQTPSAGGRIRFISAPGGVRQSGADRAVVDALDELLAALVDLQTDERWRDHVLAHVREVEDRNIVLLANCSSRELPATLRLRTDASSAERWDVETGKREPLTCRRGNECLACEVTLPPHGSAVVLTADSADAPPASDSNEFVLDLTTRWRLAEPPRNILRLGRFDFLLDDRTCAEGVPPEPIINTLGRIAGDETLPVRIHPGGFHPTAYTIEYPLTAAWRVEFLAEYIPDDLTLVVDREGLRTDAVVRLNGTELAPEEADPHFVFEHSNVGWPIPDLVEDGRNELLIRVEAQADDDGLLDALWLTGNFGVAGTPGELRRLVPPAQSVLPLDLPGSGLPHFAGTVVMDREVLLSGENTHLALDAGENGFLDCAEVFLEGRSLGVRCWPPFRWEIPDEFAVEGEATVRLEITTSAGPAIEGRAFDMEAGEYREL